MQRKRHGVAAIQCQFMDSGKVTFKPHLAKVPCFTIHIDATCIWLQPSGPQCLLNTLHVAYPASARILVGSLHLLKVRQQCRATQQGDSARSGRQPGSCARFAQQQVFLSCRQHVARIHSSSLLLVMNSEWRKGRGRGKSLQMMAHDVKAETVHLQDRHIEISSRLGCQVGGSRRHMLPVHSVQLLTNCNAVKLVRACWHAHL